MLTKMFGRRRKKDAARSGSAGQATSPDVELLRQVARLHAAVN